MRLRSHRFLRYLPRIAATLLLLGGLLTWTTAKADIVVIWAAIQASYDDDLAPPDWGTNWGLIPPAAFVNDFITQQEGHFIQLSYVLARLTRASYPDDDGPGSDDALVLGELGMKKVATLNPKSTALVTPEALISRATGGAFGSQAVVVSIRGSDTFSDWILDFAALSVSDKEATYHRGFNEYASTLKPGVDKALAPYCNDGRTRIWFTGHSLGGAAAQLLAYWTSKAGCKVHGVMTFASPTPGRADFRNDYVKLQSGGLNKNTHRWVHELDPVPCMPAGSRWVDVGTRHMLWGGDFLAAGSEPYGLYVTGSTPGMPPRPPSCAEESGNIVATMDRYVDEGVDFVLDKACPSGRAARIWRGILTAGASEVVCVSTEFGLALADVAEQVVHNITDDVDGQLALSAHKMRAGYWLPLRAAARGEITPFGITVGPIRQPDGCFRGQRCEERLPNGSCLCVDDDLNAF